MPLDRIWMTLRYQLVVMLGSRYHSFLIGDHVRNKLPTSTREILLYDPEELQLKQDKSIPLLLSTFFFLVKFVCFFLMY